MSPEERHPYAFLVIDLGKNKNVNQDGVGAIPLSIGLERKRDV